MEIKDRLMPALSKPVTWLDLMLMLAATAIITFVAETAVASEAITPEAVAAIRGIEADCDVELRNGAADIPIIGEFISIADRLSGFHAQRSREGGQAREAECIDAALADISKESEREVERRVDTDIRLCAINQCDGPEWRSKCRALYESLDSPPPTCLSGSSPLTGRVDAGSGGRPSHDRRTGDNGVDRQERLPSDGRDGSGSADGKGADGKRKSADWYPPLIGRDGFADENGAWIDVPESYITYVGRCRYTVSGESGWRCRDGLLIRDPHGRARWVDGKWMWMAPARLRASFGRLDLPR